LLIDLGLASAGYAGMLRGIIILNANRNYYVCIVIPNVCEESFFSDVLLSFILSTENIVCLITFVKNSGMIAKLQFIFTSDFTTPGNSYLTQVYQGGKSCAMIDYPLTP
jgi:hypothetical protein